jgi:hypothetical protein
MGATSAGTRMASSHTGHLAGSDAVVDGLFAPVRGGPGVGPRRAPRDGRPLRQAPGRHGGELLSLFHLGRIGHPHGRGGRGQSASPSPSWHREDPGGVAGDDPRLPHRGQPGRQRGPVPRHQSGRGPPRVFDLVAADPNIDVIVIGLTGALGRLTDRFADDIVAFADEIEKPIVVTWNSFKTDEKGFTTLIDAGIPMFRSFRNCFGALRNFARYQEASATFRIPQEDVDQTSRPRRAALAEAGRATGGALGADASRRLLEAFGVPLAGEGLAHSAAEAAAWPRPSASPWS